MATPSMVQEQGGKASDCRAQWEQLYRRYGAAIHRRCRRLLGADAEDAVHEIFLRVGSAFETTPRSAEAAFWIQRVAINYCLNELRQKRRRPALQAEPAVLDASVRSRVADVVAARDSLHRILSRAPYRAAAAAWLHYVYGMTQDEVGEALGLSRRTVTGYLANIRECASKANVANVARR